MSLDERSPIPLGRVVASLTGLLLPAFVEPDPRPHAAVLVLLFERHGDTATLLIRRSLSLATNPGDMAFPGGRLEPGERALDAALREAEEEVGLSAGFVSVLGRLPAVTRGPRGDSVVPYVGVVAGEPTVRAEPGEVDGIIEVALSDLAGEGSYWEEIWQIPGAGTRLLAFFAHCEPLADDVVWGMTAMVLRGLLSAVLVQDGSTSIA